MMSSPEAAFDWALIVDYDLFDSDRLRIGTVTAILPGDNPSETLARIVPRGSDASEILLPVSEIGIVGERWAMLDHSIHQTHSWSHDEGASAG